MMDITDLVLMGYANRTREEVGPNLIHPAILTATNFGLKGQFLNLLKEASFFRKGHKDAHKAYPRTSQDNILQRSRGDKIRGYTYSFPY